MLRKIIASLTLITFLTSLGAAQTTLLGSQGRTLYQPTHPLFGSDIVIHHEPSQNQRHIAITSAFNGWLYAVYGYRSGFYPALAIMRSVDDGASWTTLLAGPIPIINCEIVHFDIIVPGNTIQDMKIILALEYRTTGYSAGIGIVNRYDAMNGSLINQLMNLNDCYHVTLASGTPFTSNSPGPFSFGVLYSRMKNSSGDSVIFRTSSNGGESLDQCKPVANVQWPYRFRNVALAYGSRPDGGSGQYFAAWEQLANLGAPTGHIYTSRTWPDLSGNFTIPTNLDSLDPAGKNQCRNPRIACQFGNMLNDSANLTALVLCDRFDATNAGYDILGFRNLQAADHSYFTKFNLTESSGTEYQADIAFNPFDSTFMVTYFDSAQMKLPFLVNNFNLANTGSWTVVTSGYNDNPTLLSPIPKVVINPLRQCGVNTWLSEGPDGNGIAQFDAPYHLYTGMEPDPGHNNKQLFSHVYPNPTRGSLSIEFVLDQGEKVSLWLNELTGARIQTLEERYFPEGPHSLTFDLSALPDGMYFITIRTGGSYRMVKVGKMQ